MEHIAGRDEQAIENILRDALRNDLRRRTRSRNPQSKALLAPLRECLVSDLEQATDWPDLTHRLANQGYQLTRIGGGLSLRDLAGQHICNLAELGHSHTRLIRRFGCPIPSQRQAKSKVA
ncbi:hypothetical protein ACJ5NV_17025 [Loktanella agnita]